MELELYLKEVFGENIELRNYDFSNFPLLLTEKYSFFESIIQNFRLIFIVPKDNKLNLRQFEKHLDILKQYNVAYPVLVVNHIRKERRNKLIQSYIPFIDVGRKMYIPYFGLQIQDFSIFRQEPKASFSPSTQLSFFYLILNKEETITVKLLS